MGKKTTEKSSWVGHGHSFLSGLIWVCPLLLFVGPLYAQFETEPHPMDTFLKSILDFSQPTGIRGTVRYWDEAEQILWVNWESRSDEGPLFATGWLIVPGEPMLAIHPDNPDHFQIIRHLTTGTPVELVIQLDGEGKRRIQSFQDLTRPRKIPLQGVGRNGGRELFLP